MKRGGQRSWLRCAGLAALCGSRTMLGPAFVSNEVPSLRRLRPFMFCLAAVELLVDKLPGVPNRTDAAPMVTRTVAGALVALAARPPRGGVGGRVFALALGATAAAATTVVAFHLRRLANQRLGSGAMANLATGTLEDVVAVACGRRLLT